MKYVRKDNKRITGWKNSEKMIIEEERGKEMEGERMI